MFFFTKKTAIAYISRFKVLNTMRVYNQLQLVGYFMNDKFSEHPVHILIFPPLFLYTRQIPIIFLLTKMTGYAIDRLPIIVVFCFQIENAKQILSWGLSRWSLLPIACISNDKVQGT